MDLMKPMYKKERASKGVPARFFKVQKDEVRSKPCAEHRNSSSPFPSSETGLPLQADGQDEHNRDECNRRNKYHNVLES